MKSNAKKKKKQEYKVKLKKLHAELFDPINPKPYQMAKDKLGKEYGYGIEPNNR